MSTNQISKPVEDSNTEENKIKEFENWIMYFFIVKKKREMQMLYGIFLYVTVAYQLQKLPTVSVYATSHLDLLHFHALTAVLYKIWDTLHQCISTCGN